MIGLKKINTLSQNFEHEQNILNWGVGGYNPKNKLNEFVRFGKMAKKLLGGQLAPFKELLIEAMNEQCC